MLVVCFAFFSQAVNNDGHGAIVGVELLKSSYDAQLFGSTTVGVTFATLHFAARFQQLSGDELLKAARALRTAIKAKDGVELPPALHDHLVALCTAE